MTSNQKNT